MAESRGLEGTRLASEGYRFCAGESSDFAGASTQAVPDALSPGLVDAALQFDSGSRWRHIDCTATGC